MAKIEQRRALDDLYMEGVEVRFWKDPETKKPDAAIGPFEGEDGERILPAKGVTCVFVRPPNPVQREEAMRNANAKRARALVKTQRDKDSEEHLTSLAYLVDMSEEALVDYVIMAKTGERAADAERDVLSREEWKEMTTYQDAARQFAQMTPEQLENDPEWAAFSELEERYSQQIHERELQLEDADRDILQRVPRDKVEEQALKKRAEFVGSQAFLNEYQRWMNYYAAREVDDTSLLFFANVDDYATAHEAIKDKLVEAMDPFIGDGSEAKNSPRVAPGSDLSVLPETPETSESSIPEEQSA